MKNRFKLNLILLTLTAFTLLTSCADDGLDGADAEGFLKQTENGAITVEFTGKTPDGKDISETQVFAYSSPIIDETSECIVSSNTSNKFLIQRFPSPMMGDIGMNNIYIELDHSDNEFYINSLSIITSFLSNNKIVSLGGEYGDFFGRDNTIPDFSYSPATGKLKFTLQGTIPKEQTNLGGDLKMKVSVDVIVYQRL